MLPHSDPISSILIWVTLILFFALIGRYLALRFNQPPVLGELLIGVFLGNLSYFFGLKLIIILREGPAIFNILKDMLSGVSLLKAVNLSIPNAYYANQVTSALSSHQGIELIKISYILDIFSRYGIIFLLFKVGLESSFDELKHTGKASIYVALIGVVIPVFLGFFTVRVFEPSLSFNTALFVGATLSATSIGITATVLTEMKKLGTREANTILGAAMIDDVLGLVLLAIVSSIVISGAIDISVVLGIIIRVLAFFLSIILLGPFILRKIIYSFGFLKQWEVRLFVSFIFMMLFAWLATLVGLAAIIGAFAAGLIIHDGYFESEKKSSSKSLSIKHLLAPLESILAPLFFILIGIQVKLESFYDWHVLMLAGGLTLAAILGKLVSGLGGGRSSDRWLVGIGMLPRGEVGLVFASIGRTLNIISDNLFSAIILMIIITTLITPPWLKARYLRLGHAN